MATGYTAKLMEEGETFQEYALRCARAFGALIHMRDDPLDAPIPEHVAPSDWSKKKLAAAKTELERLENMGGNERIAFGEQAHAEDIVRRRASLDRDRAENARLMLMREQVEAWTPPSPEHLTYKKFMLDQITLSLHDLEFGEKYLSAAEEKAPVSYYAAAVAGAERDIEYHAAEQVKEVERAESRSLWIQQLRASLSGGQDIKTASEPNE